MVALEILLIWFAKLVPYLRREEGVREAWLRYHAHLTAAYWVRVFLSGALTMIFDAITPSYRASLRDFSEEAGRTLLTVTKWSWTARYPAFFILTLYAGDALLAGRMHYLD